VAKNRRGGQTPNYAIVPHSIYSDGKICGEFAAAYGLTPDPWQQLILDGWLACRKDGSYVAGTCGVSVPRQNGKNAILEMVELFKSAIQGRKILHTAHEVKTCRKSFLRLQGFFANERQYPELAGLVQYIRQTNGQEAIVLNNGGSIEFIARSKSSGLGFTVDDVICDEAQLLDQEQVSTLRPTMAAAPSGNPQLFLTGTPPRPGFSGGVFEQTREKALKGAAKRTCWFEWSEEEVGDVRDPQRWYKVNPALGYRLSETVIEDELATMDDDKFARERLGWWSKTGFSSVIDETMWANGYVDEAPASGKEAIGVKFSVDGTRFCVSIAVKNRRDYFVELLFFENLADGLDSLVQWIVERQHKIAGVAIDGRAGTDILLSKLREEAFPEKGLLIPGTRGVVAASTLLLNAVNERRCFHVQDGQEILNESATKSVKRDIGKDGGWSFDGDLALPIESAALALWAVDNTKRNPRKGSKLL